jgi:hypothetical protein
MTRDSSGNELIGYGLVHQTLISTGAKGFRFDNSSQVTLKSIQPVLGALSPRI